MGENGKVSKTSTKEDFGAASNQTTNVLSFAIDSVEITQLNYIIGTDECDVNLNDGKKDIEVVKINTKEVDAASEKYPKSNVEDENIIDMEDMSMCETNEEAVKEIITVNSKEDDDMFVDKIIEDNDNIREVLAISKESLGTEVKEKADIIEAEGENKVDIEEDSKNTSQGKIMTSLEETAKVKELLKISVDTKEVENIIDKIDLANVNESTKAKVKDEGMIITDEVSSIDSKNEIKTDNEGDSNISIKSRTENIINHEDTSAIVENEKVSKTSTEKYFGAASNQTTHMLSLLFDSIVIPQLRYNKVNTDECDVNLNDGKKDIEVVKINTKEVDA